MPCKQTRLAYLRLSLARWRHINGRDIRMVEEDGWAMVCEVNHRLTCNEVRHHVTAVWCSDNDPSVVIVDQHTLCSNIKPNPAVGCEVCVYEG